MGQVESYNKVKIDQLLEQLFSQVQLLLNQSLESPNELIGVLNALVTDGRLSDVALKNTFLAYVVQTGETYPPRTDGATNVFIGSLNPGLAMQANDFWVNPNTTTLEAVVAAVLDTGSSLRKALQADSIYVPVTELLPEDAAQAPVVFLGSSPNMRPTRQLSKTNPVTRLLGGVKLPNTWVSLRIRPHWQHNVAAPTAGKVAWAATITRTPHNAGASAGTFYVDNAAQNVVVSTAGPVVTPPAGGIYSFMLARNANATEDTFQYPVQLLGVEFSKES